MKKIIYSERVRQITDDVENTIFDNEITDYVRVRELIKETIGNYESSLGDLTNVQKVDLFNKVESSLKQRFTSTDMNLIRKASINENPNDLIVAILKGTRVIATIENPMGDVERDILVRDIREKYGEQICAELLPITSHVFLYSKKAEPEAINKAIELYESCKNGQNIFTDVLASNITLEDHQFLGRLFGFNEEEIKSFTERISAKMPNFAGDIELHASALDFIKDSLQKNHPNWSKEQLEAEAKIVLQKRYVDEPATEEQLAYGWPVNIHPRTWEDAIATREAEIEESQKKIKAERDAREPQPVKGFLTYSAVDNEFQFIFAENVFDAENKNNVGSIAFESKDQLKNVFAEQVINEVERGESIPEEISIQYPLTKVQQEKVKVNAKKLFAGNNIENLSFDIDFVTPLRKWAKSKYDIELKDEAISLVAQELKSIYGELKQFSSYSPGVVSSLVARIIDNPESYTLFNLTSAIKKGDRVHVLPLPTNPIGIVKEAKEGRYIVATGTVENPFIDEYLSEELLPVEDSKMFAEKEKHSQFDIIKEELEIRSKTRDVLTSTLKNVDVGLIDFSDSMHKKNAGWLGDVEEPDKLMLNDYDISKEVTLRSGVKAVIKAHNKDNSLQVKIGDKELKIWKTEIQRGER